MGEKMWTIKEIVEAKYRISASTLRRLVKEGKIAFTRVGLGRGFIYIPDSVVQGFPRADKSRAIRNNREQSR
jgi:FAD synthase